MMQDAISQFLDAIEKAGLTPPKEIVPDGDIHRFSSNGKPGDTAGWYVFFDTGIPAGCFGDWRTGAKQNWRKDIGRSYTADEESEYRAKVETMQRKRKAETATRQEEARAKAEQCWEAGIEAPDDHPYLLSKGVKSYGLRVHQTQLLIPLRIGNMIYSLQTITPEGDKLFLPGGRVKGCYYNIGVLSQETPEKVICITEGYATGATIHEATGYTVAIAFNAGNLEAVALNLKEQFPDLSGAYL